MNKFLPLVSGAAAAVAVCVLLSSCRPRRALTERDALDFLYDCMPLADSVDYPEEFYRRNVHASFQAREELVWGDSVPELLFKHFVLPLRVNNENLDSSRTVFYRELKPRVEGMSMKDAVLEVNHWCHEKLTYQPSDARTLSPLAAMRSSLGRCGEEATFAVAALRAVCIPARQVYTPRWAHTDDNHAWVEAWADGKWYFLGACEPEPVLNLGWFNAPASRGLLMHTRVFGKYDGPEEKVMEGPDFTEINLTANYAETARVDFKVVDGQGKPVEDALVDFGIYNYAEFYPALSKYTDAQGMTFLSAGLGDMLVWASKGGLYGCSKVSFGRDSLVTITLTPDHPAGPQRLMIVPPPERPNLPEVTPAQRAANDLRFAREDSVRKAYMATFFDERALPDFLAREEMREFRTSRWKTDRVIRLLKRSRGNHAVLEAFLTDHPDERALELLESLSHKDLIDVTREILVDSYDAVGSVLCPRVENEFLSPYKRFFLDSLAADRKPELKDPVRLVRWVRDSIRLRTDPKAWNIPMSPVGVYKTRYAPKRSRDIFFVALARTLGIEARKDPVTGKIQYKSGSDWADVDFEAAQQTVAPTGTLVLRYVPTPALENPGYYSHFTVSKLENGRMRLLTFDEGQVDMGSGVDWEHVFKKGAPLDAGEYVLVSGNRLSDGSVPVTMEQFSIEAGGTTTLDLHIEIPEGKLPVTGSFDTELRYRPTPESEPRSIVSQVGRGFFIVGSLTPRAEPSVHALNDLAAAKVQLEAWGRPILLVTSEEGYGWLKEYADRLPSTVLTGIDDGSIRGGGTDPYFRIADTFNRVFWSSQGYTIGLGDQLAAAVRKL